MYKATCRNYTFCDSEATCSVFLVEVMAAIVKENPKFCQRETLFIVAGQTSFLPIPSMLARK